MKLEKSEYESKMLKSEDLKTLPMKVTIDHHFHDDTVEIGTGHTLYFKGIKKPLPLNITALQFMVKKFGDETDKWSGVFLELYTVKADNPNTGEKVDALRIRVPEK